MHKLSILTLIVVLMAASLAVGNTARAYPGDPPPGDETQEGTPEASELEYLYIGQAPEGVGQAGETPAAPHLITGQALGRETEPNNTRLQANPLGSPDTVIMANIYPVADEDYFSFSASAGDRVYAATMTSFSSGSTDSFLEIVDSTGSVLEADSDDGSFASTASSIAGLVIPASQTYYVHVRHNDNTSQIRPYYLHFRLQSGAPAGETEPNNSTTTASPLLPNGWASGSINPANDVDFYSLSLNAGDTVYLSLDLDPERDGVTWNGRLGFGVFGSYILLVNDSNVTSPNSEAFFFSVKDGGTYYAYVDSAVGGTGSPTFTYQLSASVHPAEVPAGSCNTYANNTPLIIPDGGSATSTIIVPGSPRIADLDVVINLTHTNMPDLDASLQAPVGNQAGLFSDVGSNVAPGMNLVLDDEAGVPVNTFIVLNGVRVQPELSYRLAWFDHQDAGGTWTLTLYDDTTNTFAGALNNWSLTVCTPPPASTCPAGSSLTVLYSSDFETGGGGFTHSGVQDEWERGLPVFNPLTGCNSGSSCWKTDLDDTYNASSSQDLLSPAIDLTDAYLVGPVTLSWAQKYQMETATYDHAAVDVRVAGGASSIRLWEWLDATMRTSVGAGLTLEESAGWGLYSVDIRGYLGQTVELLYHLDSDTTMNLGGLAVDDVSVTGCMTSPTIYLPLIQR